MSLPNLDAEIQWWKDRLRPEDSRFGNGIADWTITAEYVPNLAVDGTPAYGALCSPGDHDSCLTPEDIEAKRAHILMFVPKDAAEMKEMRVTMFHELRHVLYAMIAPYEAKDRLAEENATHSIDNFMKHLSPEEVTLFGRLKTNPMARAYRAKEKAMPDQEKPEPDKGGGKDKPNMAEADMSIDEIKKALAEARLAGDQARVLELVDKLLVAHVSDPGERDSTIPPPPPEIGMKPEEAYARKVNAEAVKAFVDHLEVPEDKKAFLREQTSIAGVKKALAFLPKEQPKMGFDGHPALRENGGDDEPTSVFYPSGNAASMAACRVMARKKDGVSARGIHKCSPEEQRSTGQLMRFSITDAFPMLREIAEENAHRERKSNLATIGGDK